MNKFQTYHVPDIANVRPSKDGQYVLKEVAIDLQAENERIKKAAHKLASNILAHLVNETEFSDDLAMQSLAIHVKEDLCNEG